MKSRDDAVRSIDGERFDVCIIGGGATGAGCALDAQLRGLRTCLIEANDFASSSSSASTKMVHGGIRYLQQAVTHLDAGEFKVVRRALNERASMMRNAPYLTRTLDFLIPCYSRWDVLYYGIGVKMYEWFAGDQRLLPARRLARDEALRRIPWMNPERLAGAVTYADGQFDDARYNIALVKSLVAAGGEALNHARLTAFGKAPEGSIRSAEIEDRISGRLLSVMANKFVNATGPYSDTVRQLATAGVPARLRLSKGAHLLFPLEHATAEDPLLVPKTEDGRVVFVIPWLGRLLVGTTDTEAQLGDEMVVTPDETAYLLRQLNPYLAKPLSAADVASGFAGLRPLVASANSRDTKQLIRDHEVEVDGQTGLISILGGKWTTYRAMAEDTIDAVQAGMEVEVTACPTVYHHLAGSIGFGPDYWNELAARRDLAPGTARHLTEKYGTCADHVAGIATEDPSYTSPLVDGYPAIQAEVIYCVREEMARTVDDVLARRTGLELHSWRLARQASPVVASLLARELGWRDSQAQEAVDRYRSRIDKAMRAIEVEAKYPVHGRISPP